MTQREQCENWIRDNIKNTLDPINIDDIYQACQACSQHYEERIKELTPSKQALDCISIMLANEMNACVKNGANSVSMPDNLVAVAGWLSSVEQALTDKG